MGVCANGELGLMQSATRGALESRFDEENSFNFFFFSEIELKGSFKWSLLVLVVYINPKPRPK